MKIKRWTPVLVVWDDAYGSVENGWDGLDEYKHSAHRVATCGLLMKETDAGVSLAFSRDKNSGKISGFWFIPRPCIRPGYPKPLA